METEKAPAQPVTQDMVDAARLAFDAAIGTPEATYLEGVWAVYDRLKYLAMPVDPARDPVGMTPAEQLAYHQELGEMMFDTSRGVRS